MKLVRIFLVLCLSLMLLGSGIAFAARGDREALDFGYVNAASTQSDETMISGPTYVYGATVFANAANSFVLLYDSATAPAGTGKEVKVEVGEATQYGTRRYDFDPPIKFDAGVYADVTSGSVVLEYR